MHQKLRTALTVVDLCEYPSFLEDGKQEKNKGAEESHSWQELAYRDCHRHDYSGKLRKSRDAGIPLSYR